MIFKDTDDLSQNENTSQNNSSTENSNYFQGTQNFRADRIRNTPYRKAPQKESQERGLSKAAFCSSD